MKNLLENHKFDMMAGFSVALVALPLSIGIALASGAPASAGIIAAVIGGLVGSWLGGSHVTINGPAAGLIVIVLDAVMALGNGDTAQGFRGMLAASVVAGALQVAFGLFKLGRRGSSFPASVIHGMMAAIGLIIIAKQVHVLVGHPPHAKNPVMLYLEIPEALMDWHPKIFAIGVSSLVLLIILSKLKMAWVKKIPAPLVTIIFGASLAALEGLELTQLLAIPRDFSQWIIFPDFSVMSTFAGWKAALSLALVASLETVLSASAVDKLDPQHRKSNLDRDLWSKGVCNMLSASIGGLPMIAEIVRSSANVSFGAKTKMANFSHGLIILLLVLLAPKALGLIPLAALAAILIMVGSRLGSPGHFMHALKIGPDHALGFAVTMFVTLGVDLLVGIFAGAITQFVVELYLGLEFKNLIKPIFFWKEGEKFADIKVESSLTFSNFEEIKELIQKEFQAGKSVRIDLKGAEYVDHNVMEELVELKETFKEKGLGLTLELAKEHHALGQDVSSAIKKSHS